VYLDYATHAISGRYRTMTTALNSTEHSVDVRQSDLNSITKKKNPCRPPLMLTVAFGATQNT